MFGVIRSVGLVIITATVTIFFIQNLATTEVAFFTWSISAPRAVIFAIIFGLGWVTALLVQALRPRPRPRAHARSEPPRPPLASSDAPTSP